MGTVRCDVCNGIFNQSYLASHKRLAHAKKGASAAAPATAPITERDDAEDCFPLRESLGQGAEKHNSPFERERA